MDRTRTVITEVLRKQPWEDGKKVLCTQVSSVGPDPISGGETTSVTVLEWANGEGVDVALLCGGDEKITKLELTWEGMDILVEALAHVRSDWKFEREGE